MCSTVSKTDVRAFLRKIKNKAHTVFGDTERECFDDAYSVYGKRLTYDRALFESSLRENGVAPVRSQAGGFRLDLCE